MSSNEVISKLEHRDKYHSAAAFNPADLLSAAMRCNFSLLIEKFNEELHISKCALEMKFQACTQWKSFESRPSQKWQLSCNSIFYQVKCSISPDHGNQSEVLKVSAKSFIVSATEVHKAECNHINYLHGSNTESSVNPLYIVALSSYTKYKTGNWNTPDLTFGS